MIVLGSAIRVAAAPDAAVLQAESQRIAAMQKAKDCVLAVFSANGQGGGSGVVVSPDGYALSNFHVVLPCGKAMQCGMANGRVYDAVVVGLDPTGDVALIKLFGRDDFPHAELGDSDRVRPGDWVFAMGNPFLLATNLQPTVTYGIVSGVHRYQFPAGTLLEYADCLQIDASINPGNSGGPLFDAQGRLIGVNGRASFEKRGRVNVGAAYAISINQIKNFLGTLRSGRIVDHATLGARVDADADGRVVVAEILESSDAYRRGLRYDDEIVSFAGRPIATPNGFKNALGIFPKGWRAPLSFRRDGKRHDILVRLAGVHGQEELIEKAGGRQPAELLPIPKPDDEPKPGPREAEKPKNKPHKPPLPHHHARPSGAEPPVPEIVKQHFQEKRGYANYYFNVLNRQRVWKAWSSGANPDGARAAWMLAGNRLPSPFGRGAGGEGSGGEFRFEITDSGASLKLFATEIHWTAGDELSTSLLPAHSGGLLPALYLWRRLAVEGIGRFGDVYYYGTAPLFEGVSGFSPLPSGEGQGVRAVSPESPTIPNARHTRPHPNPLPKGEGTLGLFDVLVGSHKGVECRFYFDPADGRLAALEMFPDEDSDPCEVYFSDYRQSGGRFWPGRMEVRYGDEAFAVFIVEEAGLEK